MLKPPRGSALMMETPGLGHPLALGSCSVGADEDPGSETFWTFSPAPIHLRRHLPLPGTLCCVKQGNSSPRG